MKHFTVNKSLLHSFWHSSIMTIVKSSICKDHYKYGTPSLVKSRVMPGRGKQDLSFYSMYQYLEAHQPLGETRRGGSRILTIFVVFEPKYMIMTCTLFYCTVYSQDYPILSTYQPVETGEMVWNHLNTEYHVLTSLSETEENWLNHHHALKQNTRTLPDVTPHVPYY